MNVKVIIANNNDILYSNLSNLVLQHESKIEIIKVPLDKKYSPNQNAQRYFKKYNKLKNALQIVSIQKRETEQELDYIQSIVYELETSSTLEEIQDIFEEISENIIFKNSLKTKKKEKRKISKKKKKEKNYSPLHFKIDDFDLYVGRNNKENDWLTFTFANKSDIWFHTKDIHGSHVILKCGDSDVSDDVLVKCAKIAAEHSKAKQSSNVPVDYCRVKFVKKPIGSKPGMVIFTNNKTIYVNPLNN